MAKRTNFEELLWESLQEHVKEIRLGQAAIEKRLDKLEQECLKLKDRDRRTTDKGQLIRLSIIALIIFLLIIATVVGAKVPNLPL